MSKTIAKLLIANRAEIAIRIARAAEELGIATVAVYAEDDASSLHRSKTDEAVALRGRGARAYLDADDLLRAARETGCDAVHPGYGFLSESAAFAERCLAAGLTFVGPSPQHLALLGDKLEARALARRLGVPVARGSELLHDLAEARAFFASLGGAPVMLKAAFGGGGRGMRVVSREDELEDAFARCRSEAEAAFGNPALYMEECIDAARHLEVQILGDGRGGVSQLGERECSLQRRHQKVVEIAPSPTLAPALREALCEAACRLAREVGYAGLGTFEFLVGGGRDGFVFMEANPRLQVEHTVTEEVLGIDLVKAQLSVASGRSLSELGLEQARVPAPRGFAVQFRVNAERIDPQGGVRPAAGTLTALELPAGPGVRIDHAAYAGLSLSPAYDSLLLKLIVHSPEPSFAAVVHKSRRALSELALSGIDTNRAFLENLAAHPAFAAGTFTTTFLEDHARALAAPRPERARPFLREVRGADAATDEVLPEGLVGVASPLMGRLVSIGVSAGERVAKGQLLCVVEAMKMESGVHAEQAGVVRELRVDKGDNVQEGQLLFVLEPSDHDDAREVAQREPEGPRRDLQEIVQRKAKLLDAARPEAVAKRHKLGQRTARENLADLVDPGSFFEYGGLGFAARRSTQPVEHLIAISPADGVITGVGTVNAALFGAEASRAALAIYDYTVMAGTQGHNNHHKQDRLFELAARERLPVVLLAEGGGGRPGDTDHPTRPTLDVETFHTLATLSGQVPLVGVVSGRCFAGNAVLLGCCDVIIATESSNIGMGGPVMVEGAGIGSFPPEAIGPIDVQSKNGVVDVRVRDEAEGVKVAKQYLGFFQGSTPHFTAPDTERLRALVPEHRMRIYAMREVIAGLCDVGSVLELRREYASGMITALGRIEGQSVGILANDPRKLAGAIDAECSDKAARFMRLCNAFDLPILSLCDTPGFMVGPEVEKTAAVRRTCRMLVTAAQLSVPLLCVVVRKAYGLGAMAMAGGHLHAPFLTVAWPTGEFGAMGLEGSVQLAYKKQLEAIADPEERAALTRKLADGLREHGKALNVASLLEIDDVIDPADTRDLLARALNSVAKRARNENTRRFIDTW